MSPIDSVRPTLFVHIGTHKTGTTSIQNFLRTYASSLRECGIFVPTAGTLSPISGHHNIAWQVRNDPRYITKSGGIHELIAQLKSSQADVGVISSEEFEYLTQYPCDLKAFDDRLENAGFATKYLVYFRNAKEYARSLFCELEAEMGWLDYDEFIKSIQNDGFIRVNGDWHYEFRYGLFVEKWQAVLGAKIHQHSYDEAVRGVGLLPSFLTTIGASKAVANESLNAPMFNTSFDKYQYVVRELTAIKRSTSWRLTAPLRSAVDYWRSILRQLTMIATSIKAFVVGRWFAILAAILLADKALKKVL
jgi:hypothetical protein